MMGKYLSNVSRAAEVKYEREGARTEDLEKKVFGSEYGREGAGAKIRQLEAEVQGYERKLVELGLEQYDGMARMVMGTLEGIGVPVVQWAVSRRARQLERVLGELETKRGGYDRDIHDRQKHINRQCEVRDAARVLAERYQNMLTDMKATMAEQGAAHAENIQEAAQRDSKAYLASGMQLNNLRSDYELTAERLRASLLKLDQAKASIAMLDGIQTQMYALRQRVHKSELRVRRVLEHARIMDSSTKLSIPAAVHDIAEAELTGTAIADHTRKVEDATWGIVEKIHSYDGMEYQERDGERQQALRTAVAEEDDRLLQQALTDVQ